jgi:hypothetical protein
VNTPYESPEHVALYHAYTGGKDTVAAHMADARTALAAEDVLIVATSRDIALYPGGGRPPEAMNIRLASRGFKELAAVSHLGPAMASLVRLRQLRGDDSWRADAEALLAAVEVGRAADTADRWRNDIAVEAFAGREQAISDMVDYSCAVTIRYLRRALNDETYLNQETLVRDLLTANGSAASINAMMVATFFLVAMNTAHRVIRWFEGHHIDWNRAMVLVAGQQGRPSAGVTWNTSSVATMIVGVSRGQLPIERLYMVPHAAVFGTPKGGDLAEVAAMEGSYRSLWGYTRATVELGDLMFPGLPAYRPAGFDPPDLEKQDLAEISDMPVIHSADDMTAMTTRLRVVLEDPRQLLSGAVTDFAVAQILENDGDLSKVSIPGLTGVDYPTVR